MKWLQFWMIYATIYSAILLRDSKETLKIGIVVGIVMSFICILNDILFKKQNSDIPINLTIKGFTGSNHNVPPPDEKTLRGSITNVKKR
jgi:hypothetical protein